jgi:hypothetical protein
MSDSNRAIGPFVGKEVKVWSQEGDTRFTDEGVLEAFDHPWLRLRTHAGEVLCFSVHNIRLVKLL